MQGTGARRTGIARTLAASSTSSGAWHAMKRNSERGAARHWLLAATELPRRRVSRRGYDDLGYLRINSAASSSLYEPVRIPH